VNKVYRFVVVSVQPVLIELSSYYNMIFIFACLPAATGVNALLHAAGEEPVP
jgi:hypothetical protein